MSYHRDHHLTWLTPFWVTLLKWIKLGNKWINANLCTEENAEDKKNQLGNLWCKLVEKGGKDVQHITCISHDVVSLRLTLVSSQKEKQMNKGYWIWFLMKSLILMNYNFILSFNFILITHLIN